MNFDFMTSLGQVATIFDGPHATPKKTDSGPYFLSISSLNHGTLDLNQSAHLGSEDFIKWTRRVRPIPGDVLFSYETRLGEAALMPEGITACLGRRMGLLRPNREKVLPEYLLYAYLSPQFQGVINQRKIHGATVERISLSELAEYPIRIPPVSEQLKVVSHLHSLDRRIQLSHQINQTLESMAQAIFKSWFVDFDPVRARMAALEAGGSEEDALLAAMQTISGKDPEQLAQMAEEQPEEYAELKTTARLFPSAMQDSELGEIPKGWSTKRLEQFVEFNYGKSLKRTERVPGPYPVYGSGGITGTHTEWLVKGPGIIVGRKGTVGSIFWERQNFTPIDTTYYISTKPSCTLVFAYRLLQTLGLEDMNTDAAVPGLNRNNAYRLLVPSYSIDLVEKYSSYAIALSNTIDQLNNEIELLTNLRDTLLPKLLSGELTVSELPATEVLETGDV